MRRGEAQERGRAAAEAPDARGDLVDAEVGAALARRQRHERADLPRLGREIELGARAEQPEDPRAVGRLRVRGDAAGDAERDHDRETGEHT